MKRLALVLLFVVAAAPAVYAQTTLVANMTGGQEVPGPGDPDGTGTAIVTITGNTINYTIVVRNITLPPVAQHIHTGGPGVANPPLVDLPGTWVGNTLIGSTTAAPATIAAILANPGGFYVNVHTTDFPGGAVRGQLAVAPAGSIPTASTWALIGLATILAFAGIFAIRQV